MARQDLTDWIREQLYVGKRLGAKEEEEVEVPGLDPGANRGRV
jgi:hypothetical protein